MIVLASINDRAEHRGTVYNTATGNMAGRERLEFLAPGWTIVMAHKNKLITDDQYIHGYTDRLGNEVPGYRAILQARWKDEIKPWLDSLNEAVDCTLCCFCREGKFCHRQYIASILKHYRPELSFLLH